MREVPSDLVLNRRCSTSMDTISHRHRYCTVSHPARGAAQRSAARGGRRTAPQAHSRVSRRDSRQECQIYILYKNK